MAKVRTVMGDVDPSVIGIALIHEHLFFERAGSKDQDRRFMDFAGQLREVEAFKQQGGSCVVDQTTIDLGRQPALLKRMAEATQMHIVAGTGFYHEEWYPESVGKANVDEIAEIMTKELEEAIEGTGFRAGLIGEIGSSETGTTANEEKVIRAAGRAHRATGAPISTHTMAGSEALHQIDILAEEGVDPRRVIVSHVDLDHVEHIRMIADRGAFLGIDTIGKPRYRDEYRLTGDEIRLEVVFALVEAGYEDQIVLSHDISRTNYLRAYGGRGYGHLLGSFVPQLAKRLSEKTIQKFLVDNPRRALSF